MAYVQKNFIPISMAVLLHAIMVVLMFVAPEFARTEPMTPMVIQATVVEDIPVTVSRAPEPEPEPVVEEPEPEPEPVVEEPEPEPDNSEELRRQAEEEKRIQDALLEEQRLEEIRRQEEADKRRREQEEADRKKREEEELERKRIEDERKRQEAIDRQREENRRRQQEMEAEQRAMEIADEERIAAENASSEMAVYQARMQQHIRRRWAVPASMADEDLCVVDLEQDRAGNVRDVRIVSCTTSDEAVRRSIIAAVQNASPLPQPSSPNLFRAELRFRMGKQQ